MIFGKISTCTCIQALKFRVQALFLMQIQNLKSDCRGFDFLIFLGIKSVTNHDSQRHSFQGCEDQTFFFLQCIQLSVQPNKVLIEFFNFFFMILSKNLQLYVNKSEFNQIPFFRFSSSFVLLIISSICSYRLRFETAFLYFEIL